MSTRQTGKLITTSIAPSKNTTPNLPLEIWNIILDYVVADCTKAADIYKTFFQVSFLRRDRQKSWRFQGNETYRYMLSFVELCKVNRAFNASVKRQKVYTQIWSRKELLDPIHRIFGVWYDICKCGKRCRGAECEGKWTIHYDTATPDDPKELERMSASGELDAISSDFLPLLFLPDNLHFDVIRVFDCEKPEYFLAPLIRKLADYIALNLCLPCQGAFDYT